MHKQLINEFLVEFELEPYGPLLIKASDNTDPVRPDMEFVRTRVDGQSTIYLPGSSLKGAFRSHCEKIGRTLQGKATVLACEPINSSCGKKFNKNASGEEVFKASCFVCQMFGNTSLGSHTRIADALPVNLSDANLNPNRNTEVRNGVAIDRLYGSVAVGPFQFEVTTAGRFASSLTVRNFSLAQLGLLGLVFRDLEQQRLVLGFAKSRGLGRVKLHYRSLTVRYPLGQHVDGKFRFGKESYEKNALYGVGALVDPTTRNAYSFEAAERETMTLTGLNPVADPLDGVTATLQSLDEITAFWRECARRWQQVALAEGRQTA
jgi:CRISPR-associated RAMP protein (TIGR02581 family)